MLYYRTHASRPEHRPPELDGWAPGVGGFSLDANTVGDYRVIGLCQPLGYQPPEDGWHPSVTGWEVAKTGDFPWMALANPACKWKVGVREVDGEKWLCPMVLTSEGHRAFSVVYGGPEFMPILTQQQKDMVDLANEIRGGFASGTWPDMPIRARWAARLMSLPYHLSPQTVGALGLLSEEVIDAYLQTAVGHGGIV